jgi:D-alanine-D-alanine ligase
MKKFRILSLVHDHLVPPEDTTGIDVLEAEWKMEYDVIETLREMGHEVRVLGIHDELKGIRPTI